MKQLLYSVVVIITALSVSNCMAQESKESKESKTALDKKVEAASQTSNLLLPSPPVGYLVVRQPLTADGKFIGFNIIVQKEGSISKVLIRVDLREEADFSVRGWKSGAVKGYINGVANNVTAAEFRVVDSTIPDVDNDDLNEELRAVVQFENKAGSRIYLNQRIFFDQRGFAVSVITGDEVDLNALVAWADQVQPIQQ